MRRGLREMDGDPEPVRETETLLDTVPEFVGVLETVAVVVWDPVPVVLLELGADREGVPELEEDLVLNALLV